MKSRMLQTVLIRVLRNMVYNWAFGNVYSYNGIIVQYLNIDIFYITL